MDLSLDYDFLNQHPVSIFIKAIRKPQVSAESTYFLCLIFSAMKDNQSIDYLNDAKNIYTGLYKFYNFQTMHLAQTSEILIRYRDLDEISSWLYY